MEPAVWILSPVLARDPDLLRRCQGNVRDLVVLRTPAVECRDHLDREYSRDQRRHYRDAKKPGHQNENWTHRQACLMAKYLESVGANRASVSSRKLSGLVP